MSRDLLIVCLLSSTVFLFVALLAVGTVLNKSWKRHSTSKVNFNMPNKLRQLQHNTVNNKAHRSNSVCTHDSFREIDSFYQIDLEAINVVEQVESSNRDGIVAVV